jgi:hypothetical protein
MCRRCNAVKGARITSDTALIWYRGFRKLALSMGLGALAPPPLGCIGPEPTLSRLAHYSLARARAGRN